MLIKDISQAARYLIALLLTCACGCSHAQSTPSLQSLIDTVRPSVVKVEAAFANGVSAGTGFFINAGGDVVTANHVIHPPGTAMEPIGISVKVRFPTIRGNINLLASFQSLRARLKAIDARHDIAVLEPIGPSPFENPMFGKVLVDGKFVGEKLASATLSNGAVRDGQLIFISGYPLQFPTLITTAGIIASSDPIAFDGISPRDTAVSDAFWADIHANHGNSGGPVFSQIDGSVIGILVSVVPTPVEFIDGGTESASGVQGPDASRPKQRPIGYNSGIARIVPTEYLIAVLRANQIRYDTATSEPARP